MYTHINISAAILEQVLAWPAIAVFVVLLEMSQAASSNAAVLVRPQCRCAIDPANSCCAFDYVTADLNRHRTNIIYFCNGRVKFMSATKLTEWHGRYKWFPDETLEVHFNCQGNGGSPHPVLLRRTAANEWTGVDYLGRDITIRSRRTSEFCPRCRLWKP